MKRLYLILTALLLMFPSCKKGVNPGEPSLEPGSEDFLKYGPGVTNVSNMYVWRGSKKSDVTDCSVSIESSFKGNKGYKVTVSYSATDGNDGSFVWEGPIELVFDNYKHFQRPL